MNIIERYAKVEIVYDIITKIMGDEIYKHDFEMLCSICGVDSSEFCEYYYFSHIEYSLYNADYIYSDVQLTEKGMKIYETFMMK